MTKTTISLAALEDGIEETIHQMGHINLIALANHMWPRVKFEGCDCGVICTVNMQADAPWFVSENE